MPVFFIDESQVRDGTVHITGSLVRHLYGSLRVQPGEHLTVVVPRQRRYHVCVERADPTVLMASVVETQPYSPPSCPQLILAQALLKGERMDWLIQKATELGVEQISPLVARQSVVRPKSERIHAQQERWNRIALEAAQQAERWESPTITAPMDSELFFTDHSTMACRMILSERTSGQSLTAIGLPSERTAHVIIAVGPEGGWQEKELEFAAQCGFVSVTLGTRILRAETAGLAALTVIQTRLGQLG